MNTSSNPRPDPREPEPDDTILRAKPCEPRPDAGTPRPGPASALLQWQIGLARRLLDGTIERLPRELLHRLPPGTAAPAGACYAHAVLSEDLIVNGVLAGGRPLAFTTWADRTGLSDLPDLPVSRSSGLAMPVSRPLAEHASWRSWSRRVQIDLPRLRQYAQAVHTATDAYLAALPNTALDPARRELEGCLLNALLLTIATRRGEITALLAVMGEPAASSPPADCHATHPTA